MAQIISGYFERYGWQPLHTAHTGKSCDTNMLIPIESRELVHLHAVVFMKRPSAVHFIASLRTLSDEKILLARDISGNQDKSKALSRLLARSVYLVGKHEDVGMARKHTADFLNFVTAQHLAHRIVRRVQNDLQAMLLFRQKRWSFEYSPASDHSGKRRLNRTAGM